MEVISAGEQRNIDDDYWYIFHSGWAKFEGIPLVGGDELGIKPFSKKVMGSIKAESNCQLVRFAIEPLSSLLKGTPQLNFLLRKYRVSEDDPGVDWLRGPVTSYKLQVTGCNLGV